MLMFVSATFSCLRLASAARGLAAAAVAAGCGSLHPTRLRQDSCVQLESWLKSVYVNGTDPKCRLRNAGKAAAVSFTGVVVPKNPCR
jgi:hypothetical protein